MKVMTLGLGWALSLLSMAPAALAEKVLLPMEDVGVIVGPREEGRVLFRHAALTDTGPIVIGSVIVRVPVAPGDRDLDYRLRVHPLLESWESDTVSWTGWSEPGGVFDEEMFAPLDLRLGPDGGELEIDITGLFGAAREGDLLAVGYVLVAAPGEGDGVRSADLDRLRGFANGVLEVTFRRVAPRPEGRVR